jgi:hypothetical protein
VLGRGADRADDYARAWLWLVPAWLLTLLLTVLAKEYAPFFVLTVLMLVACVRVVLEDRVPLQSELDKAS